MSTESQVHPLKNGSLTIYRNGKHQYWTNEDETKRPGVTSIAKLADGDMFSVGSNWATKIIRESDGDVDAPRRVGDEARDIGAKLHTDIDNFINRKGTAEENKLFVHWLNHCVGHRKWLASEQLVISEGSYGGTTDAFSDEESGLCLWDWKTVTSQREPYKSTIAQMGGYTKALREMGSIYAPDIAYVGMISRDATWSELYPVDLVEAVELFEACLTLYRRLKNK
tara:strand:- start:233 stop:907 length:675 start_codon:yes stop_codon:yes gene_type:complete